MSRHLARVILAGGLALGFAAMAPGTGHGAAPGPMPRSRAVTGGPHQVLLRVERLTCSGCAERATATLRRLPGVVAVAADLRRGTVAVEYDPRAIDPRELASALSRAGYPARFLAAGSPARPGGVPEPAAGSPPCTAGCCVQEGG